MSRLRCFYIFFFCASVALAQTKQRQSLTQLADSLDLKGEYSEALTYRVQALEENQSSKFLKAKWHYTQSCILETNGGRKNLLKALEHSRDAYTILESIASREDRNLFFKHLILNRIYHQCGYTGQWQDALIHAKKDFEVARDTFPEHEISLLFILDDLGYIYTKLGNPEKSNEYYGRSFKLYKKHHPENLKEVYVNNHRIISNFRELGLKKEEFKLLEESEDFWVNSYEGEDAFYQRFIIYGQLADWHINYGNKELAKSYLFKKEELFDSVSNSRKKTEKIALIRRERVHLNESYIQVYLKYKDFSKAQEYITETKKLLKDSTDKYRWNIESKANLYVTESKLPDVEFDSAEKFLKKALSLVLETEEVYNINSLQYQIELFNLYASHKKKEEAFKLFDEILNNDELTRHNKTQLLFKKAFLLEDSLSNEKLVPHIKTAFNSLLKSPSDLDFENVTLDQLQEFYTFEILNNLLEVANFYYEWYKQSQKKEYLNTSFNLFSLSSDFFGRIYKGDRFNENLYASYKTLEKGLLNCAILKSIPEISNSVLEALENNSSKLTWSKFLYGKNTKINVPDSLLLKEENLQALINYYQERIYEEKQSQADTLNILKLRLTDLNNQLSKHQDYISRYYSQYRSVFKNTFDIKKLKSLLKPDEVLLNYIVNEDNVFAFTITATDTRLEHLIKNKDVASIVNDFKKTVSIFNSEIDIPDTLKKLIVPIEKSDKQNVVIVHSGILSLLPFEVLLPDYFKSNKTLSYSGSLKIYTEQINAQQVNEKMNVGIFKAQNGSVSNQKGFLPSLDREIQGIKDVTQASDYFIKTKDDFFQHVNSHNVLHLSMHTTIDEEMPELSVLNFADSELLIGSLYNTSLNADLAVLSACDTGNGSLYQGEGIQSISRAFTFAGVPSTVLSLWKVDDNATATLMGSFYKYLQEGKSKNVALKLAKQDYLNSNIDSELKHPYYWSGFVLSGNTESFKPEKRTSHWWLLVLLIPLMAYVLRKKNYNLESNS